MRNEKEIKEIMDGLLEKDPIGNFSIQEQAIWNYAQLCALHWVLQ